MFDEERRIYVFKNKEVKLTLQETKLLSLLIKNKGSVVRYKKILRYLYQDYTEEKTYDIRPLIFNLRKKLFAELDIVTVFGYGLVIFYK